MRSLLLVLMNFLFLQSNGQGNFTVQYKLIKKNIIKPYETFRDYDYTNYAILNKQFKNDTFFVDYILKKYSKDNSIVKFISNRYYLRKFTDIYLKQNAVRLSLVRKDTIEINVEKEYKNLTDLGEVKYDSTYVGKITEPNYEFKYIKTVNGKQAYGLTFDTSVITKIKFISIKINEKETQIDKTMLEDLYFPNFCEVDYAIKPIEAFLSPDGNYIYIYLFGGQENLEYFCKIIFDIKKKSTVGRMIADHKELGIYQCISKNFIGF